MLYIIGATLVILGIIFPKNKFVTLCLLGYMWVIFAFNTANADYRSYEYIYRRIALGNLWSTTVKERGFVYLVYLCANYLKINYQQFLILLASMATVMFGVVIIKFTKNTNVVLALFICNPYWLMICQHRSYIALIFVMIGVYFLLFKEGLKGEVLFIVCVCVGALFHVSVLIYLVFLVCKKIDSSMIAKIVPILILGIFILRSNVFVTFISHYISSMKAERWLRAAVDRTWIGIFLVVVVHAAMVGIEYYIWQTDRSNEQISHKCNKLEENIFKITLICFPLTILEIYSYHFERLFRLLLLLFYILSAEYVNEHRINIRKMSIIHLSIIGYIFMYFVYFYIAYNGWFLTVFRPILENNLLLS